MSMHDELSNLNKELCEAKTSAYKSKATRSRYSSVDSQSSLPNSPRKKSDSASEIKRVRSTINTLSHTLDTVRGLHEQADKRSQKAAIHDKEDDVAKVQMRDLITNIQKSTKKLIKENEKASVRRERSSTRMRSSSFHSVDDSHDIRRFPSFDSTTYSAGGDSPRKSLYRSLNNSPRSSIYQSKHSGSLASKYANDREAISAKLSSAKLKLKMLQNSW